MNCADLATDKGPTGLKRWLLGFWGVILGLRNDLTKAAGVVKLFGSVPLEKSPKRGY
jgi:hypothetical protein